MSTFSYDCAIIGAGPGGYVAAIRAAQLGLKTILFEKDRPGGVCLNIGCIPSKSLLHQAELFRSLSTLRSMGVVADTSNFDYAKVWQKSRDVANRLSKGVQGLLRKNKVELVMGTAKLVDKNTVALTDAANQVSTYSAQNIIIATGSRPKIIPGYEFDQETVISSNELLMLSQLPASLVILGAGAIGVEAACIMASFGVKVDIVEIAPRILPNMDPDAAKLVETELRSEGVQVYSNCKAGALDYTEIGISLEIIDAQGQSRVLEAEKIMIAGGRVPNLDSIGIDKVGLSLEKGCIPVDKHYQSAIPGVYAIGDVVNTPQLAHLASKEAEIAVEHIKGHTRETAFDLDLVPFAVYAKPEIASFGPTEEQAKQRNINFKAFSFPYLGIGRAIANDCPQGFVKILADGDKIIAAHIVGSGASDLIHELLLAKSSGLKPSDVAELVHTHPSLSEGVMEAARGIEGWAIHI